MDNSEIQLVGGPCGQHGPYTFYKAFKYTKNGIKRIVTLSEFFFVKLWIDSDLLCIGELQLLWSDKNSDQVLASLRLYFLPENTPDGRMDHGEDEVLAIAEKVVLRVEDLITWITVDAEWTWGRLARCEKDVKDAPQSEENKSVIGSLSESSLDFSDVEKERKTSDCNVDYEGPLVIILSYPRYCRYRAMMRRLEGVENEYLKYKIVNALGGFTAFSKNTRVLFCKDTFDYPELEGHELLCNHLAPKLKGRPRGRRKKRSVSPGSESNESESSISNVFNSSSKEKIRTEDGRSNGLRCDTSLRRSTRSVETTNENKEFLKELTVFMKTNYTPIGRIPSLGYKELDLYSFYVKVQKLGGYDSVTANRLWKSIFDDMSGHANSTSAATVIRRHYERFLLPYERYVKGEEYKPLPISERRRLKSKAGSSASDAETSESTSRSGNSTPVPQTAPNPATPTTPTENKEFSLQYKSDGKTSSLRSVRVKPERQKDKQGTNSDKFNNSNSMQLNNNNEFDGSTELSEDGDKVESDKHKIIDNSADDNNSSDDNKQQQQEKVDSVVKVEHNNSIVPEKDVEPLTSAVAPIAQKLHLEKSHSPVDGKENIPIIKTGDTPSNSKSPEIIEVPYKPKSPEIIDLEVETNYTPTTKLHQPFLHEVKKRKLDMLKEGGLEVTPVRAFIPPTGIPKDMRPSVIQPTGAQILAKSPIKTDIGNMPPPTINTVPTRRTMHNMNLQQTLLNISQVKTAEQLPIIKTPPKQQFPYVNGGSLPPKVLQSRSIYSYSEKTVYGNPKDCMMPPMHPVHTPKFVGPPRSSGGDLLDLTVTSPQKPMVEIVKVPSMVPPVFNHPHKPYYNKSPAKAPVLDGRRLGSNLEITLVGPNSKQATVPSNPTPKYNLPQQPTANYPHSRSYVQKRQSMENYSVNSHAKVPRIEENGKVLNKTGQGYDGKMEITIPYPYSGARSSGMKAEVGKAPLPSSPAMAAPMPNSKHFLGPNPSNFPYLPHVYEGNKTMPNYLPFLDPIYYSAMNFYSHATPPILPFSSTEQLKLYTDLMAHNSRLNFNPFPDGNPSMVNNNNNSFKKP